MQASSAATRKLLLFLWALLLLVLVGDATGFVASWTVALPLSSPRITGKCTHALWAAKQDERATSAADPAVDLDATTRAIRMALDMMMRDSPLIDEKLYYPEA
jgi:hypothetical protein